MKEGEVASLVRQLLQADKVIHEQQLGWSWTPPDDALFTPSSPQVSWRKRFTRLSKVERCGV
jgi:hypothetical protein